MSRGHDWNVHGLGKPNQIVDHLLFSYFGLGGLMADN